MPLGPLRDEGYIGNQGGGGRAVAFGYLWKPTAVHMAHPSPVGDAFSHLEMILGIAFKVS